MRIAAVALLALLAGCSSMSDSISTGFGLFSPSGAEPVALAPLVPEVAVQQVWSADLGENKIYSFTPAVDRNAVFAAASNGTVMRLAADSGQVLWQAKAPFPLTGGCGYGDGLVVVTGGEGEALALDALDGSVRWQARVGAETVVPAWIDDGKVVLHPLDGRVLALDAKSGEELWVYRRKQPALTLRAFSGLAVAHGGVFAGFGAGQVVAIDLASGAPAWEEQVAQPHGSSDVERLADVAADPVIQGDGLFVAAYQGKVVAVDPRNGEVRWGRDFSSYYGLAADDRRVYVSGAEGDVGAFAQDNGASVWKQSALRTRQPGTPAVMDSWVVLGDVQGLVHVLAKEDGRLVGRLDLGGSPIRARPVVAGDLILVQTGAGKIYALRIQ